MSMSQYELKIVSTKPFYSNEGSQEISGKERWKFERNGEISCQSYLPGEEVWESVFLLWPVVIEGFSFRLLFLSNICFQSSMSLLFPIYISTDPLILQEFGQIYLFTSTGALNPLYHRRPPD